MNTLERCRKVAASVFLACDEEAAQDIHDTILWLVQQTTAAREENEKLMNVDYWPERAHNAEKQVASLKRLISRVLTEKVHKQELEDALK
jgi:hypothetical protein